MKQILRNFLTAIQRGFKSHPRDIAAILLLGLAGLAVGLWSSDIILDDAVITYRVAENLAHGRGLVYNVGERIQVTTTPLYALVLALGTWLFGSAPRAALAFNISLSALIPVLAYDLGRRLAGRITGLAGALLLIFSPFLIMAFSMESYLYAALILAAMEAYTLARWRWAGIFAGLTAMVRGDAVSLGAAMLIYDLLARRRLRWRLIIPAAGIPASWYLFAWFYYGSPFPATLGAKVAQGQFNWLGRRFLEGLLGYWQVWTQEQGHTLLYLIPILIILGLIPVIRVERDWLIMVGRDALYLAIFIGLGVPAAEWYYAPLMPGVALMTARGIQFVAESIALLIKKGRKEAGGRWSMAGGQVVAVILTTLLITTLYPLSRAIIHQNPDWKAQVYPDTARWIAANTNASATLATIDIGHLGYWSGRRIIDIVGLAQPDVSPHIARGDFGYALRHYRPDMVLIGFSWIPEVQSTDWFQADYAPRRAFKFAAIDEPLMLFSRRREVKVQPDTIPVAAQPLDVDFNRQLTLTGAHTSPALGPGSPLTLTLFWRADAPIEVDFTVFAQLVDAENTLITQQDSRPQQGFYATPHWQPGETIIDTHTLFIPADTPPGDYALLVGLYDPATGYRLQILDEAGEFQRDHVRLEGVRVQE